MKPEEVNVIFAKLAYLAGSRQASWSAIAACRAKYRRTPTLAEVVEHITTPTPEAARAE